MTVSTTLQLDLDDPRWPQWIADAVANQAREGASRLRDELLAQTPPPRRLGFVPLAALVDCTQPR